MKWKWKEYKESTKQSQFFENKNTIGKFLAKMEEKA